MSSKRNQGRGRRLVAGAGIVLAVALCGCSDEGGDGMLAPSEATFSSQLRLLDPTNQEAVAFDAGQPVTFELKLTNLTDGAQTVNLPSAQLFDFSVTDPSGDGVWRWSSGRGFATVITPLLFAPHESREFTAVWDQTDDAGKAVGPGDYDAAGRVPCADPGCAAGPIRFEIR